MLDATDSTEIPHLQGRIKRERRIAVLPGSTDSAASFEIENEDHTLGNALRWIIMKNPDVEFCGYSIPHPAENKMNFRIQTYDDNPAIDILLKGLDDLMDLCDAMEETFTTVHSQHSR